MTGIMTESGVLDALRSVIDPELGINVVDLGLVYGAAIEAGRVSIDLTMTTPSCPLGDFLKDEASDAIRRHFPDVAAVEVNLVWEPPWGPERISAEGKRALGWQEESDREAGYSAWSPPE
jgi:metal-sulfur cluster biosynthetic enzyme